MAMCPIADTDGLQAVKRVVSRRQMPIRAVTLPQDNVMPSRSCAILHILDPSYQMSPVIAPALVLVRQLPGEMADRQEGVSIPRLCRIEVVEGASLLPMGEGCFLLLPLAMTSITWAADIAWDVKDLGLIPYLHPGAQSYQDRLPGFCTCPTKPLCRC